MLVLIICHEQEDDKGGKVFCCTILRFVITLKDKGETYTLVLFNVLILCFISWVKDQNGV